MPPFSTIRLTLLTAAVLCLLACSSTPDRPAGEDKSDRPLPYLGQHDIATTYVNGIQQFDTLHHVIPPFALINQDSLMVTNATVEGQLHVAQFFFTSCPSVCPAVTEQLKRLRQMTQDIDELIFLSYTIDPERDHIPQLRKYMTDRKVDPHNWHFLYGSRDEVYPLAERGYLVNASEDAAAAGGFLHSEHLILVDRSGHIRGVYTGTAADEVNRLHHDIRKLIAHEPVPEN